MLEALLNGVMLGIVVSIVLICFVMFTVHKFNFKSYVPTFVYVVVSKDTPLWWMIFGVTMTCVLASMINWGWSSGGVAKAAVLWGVVMHFGTFWFYRIIWAISEVGPNPKYWNNVWRLTRNKPSIQRAADQKITFAILVTSVILTTWLAVQGVYG